MTDKEIYEQLKEGVNPSYIDGLRNFDTSEVIQWMISYHQEVNAELLEALQDVLYELSITREVHDGTIRQDDSAIARALGKNDGEE